MEARLKNVVGRSGVTVNGIALHHSSDTLLQVAGSSIIVSSAGGHDRFEGHLISQTKQQFTCVAVTACGKYAATGETGHQPAVRLWQLRDEQGNFIGRLIRSMQAHTVSVTIVRFTPDDSTLISIGCQHDAQIITWDWRNGHDLGVGKLMSPVNALTISFDSSMCVTVGSKSVKYWFLPLASDGMSKRTGLTSRSAILADKRNVNFVDATFCDATNRMVAVTSSGELLEFNGNKKYVKCYSWKESGDFKAICIAKIPEGLLVGCSDGLVRLFCLIGEDLDFLADLAPPTHLFQDPSNVYESQQLQNHPEDAIFPEPRCLVASTSNATFVVGYADRSLIEFARENKSWSFRRASLGHTGSVNCIEPFPSSSPCLPAGTLITGGADGTVRFWNFSGESEDKKEIANILCPSLLKVVYLDENPDLLIDKRNLESIGPSNEEPATSSSGVLCTRVTHDGRMMIAGTSAGMLYLIDLSFSDTPIIDVINAHDNDVTSIDFSDHATTSSHDQPMFLASGGRDRFVHVFRRIPYSSQFVHCAVLDGHQSAIKSIKFASNNGQLHLYTAATDRSLIIWKLNSFSDQHSEFTRVQQISVTSSIGDMTFIKYVEMFVVGGHDRMLRQFDINGKLVREVKGTDDDVAHSGKIQKLAVDHSGSYAISVCSDKYVYVVDLRTGVCLAVLCGFGAPPTDATFSDDFKNVIVTTSNGAIFVWQLAKNLTERMISAQVRLMEEVTMRTATPDSLLGSGSETISSNSFTRPLGAPEFSGSSASLYSDDDDSTRFSSSVRSSRTKRALPNGGHLIGNSSYARVGDSSFSPAVQSAPAVERRTHTNLFSHDQYETDISETQSDFVSSRRKHRVFSDEDDQDSNLGSGQYLAAPINDPRRSASPSLYSTPDHLREYQSSKSMMNLRDVTGGGVRVQTAKELMMSHIASQRNSQSGSSSHLSSTNTPTSGRMKWENMAQSSNNNDWHPSSTVVVPDIHHVSPVMATSMAPPPQHQYGGGYRNDHHHAPSYPMPDTTHPPPLAPRTTSRVLTAAPSQQALQQIQANSPFRRKSMDRNSLSKKFLDNGGAQPKTVWSPSALANSGAPRRSNSNLFAATNLEVPTTNLSRRHTDKQPQKLRFTTTVQTREISLDHESDDDDVITSTTLHHRRGQYQRRPSTVTVDTRDADVARRRVSNSRKSERADDLNFASSLRSRSQSPNKLALSQMINSRERDTPSSPSSTTGSSIVGRNLQQRRRDSDVSYVRSATRGRDEMRKSTDALNKLMAVRSKLHQSSENLRKSTENLALLKNLEEASNYSTPKSRTRSSSNLRNAEVLGNMESFGTFDADSRMRSGSTSSLAQSRMMARSIGNLNEGLAMEGSQNTPSQRLANTIQMMRKASNPDLTAPEQFEDTGSPFAQRMARGAVQKKMERYRAKNKSGSGNVVGRNQTSEESDSNNSDMMPLSINKRALTAGNRSTTGSDFSPASSRGSSSLAMGSGPIGSGLPSSRRLYDQQRSGGLSASGTPRRTGNNYLVTKMSEQMNKSMEGPDLGSDESPRSSVNSHEWQNLMENSQDGTKNPLICHVQDCMEQLRIHVDKSLQAKKLVEDDTTLAIEQKKIVMCEIDRSIERLIEKLNPNQVTSKPSDRSNGNLSGNDYTPKGANIYGILKENLSSRQ
ncbi:hypothetical protein GCK72_017097 [Caenorhabditis remanei]|uniref:Uncharacterized protein n=1 Tax=Caenorhabditis remanei TaxID=31234 RepID=A0A6A5G6S1_CAERE|nr:hypothetical protein GCK72_017097 [Caenorhabditis remanei]KAF1750546.1 hypothetical protein GCK72_017097 [Caenorhabditis remanei]